LRLLEARGSTAALRHSELRHRIQRDRPLGGFCSSGAPAGQSRARRRSGPRAGGAPQRPGARRTRHRSRPRGRFEGGKAAALYQARLVIVDSQVSGGCIQAVQIISVRAPDAWVLVVAPELDPAELLAAVRAGAKGFVTETLGAAGLARAVEVALRGDTVIPRAGVAALIEQLRARGQGQTSIDGIQLQLTRREG
jgi:hypothetical protein